MWGAADWPIGPEVICHPEVGIQPSSAALFDASSSDGQPQSKAMAILLLLSSFVSLAAASWRAQGCTAVTKDECGTDLSHSCLRCGNEGAYDCEECCDGCSQVVKGSYTFCDCKGPTPAPGPRPSGDSWESYAVASMDVISVTGGPVEGDYDKAVVLLHGGGGSGAPCRRTCQRRGASTHPARTSRGSRCARCS